MLSTGMPGPSALSVPEIHILSKASDYVSSLDSTILFHGSKTAISQLMSVPPASPMDSQDEKKTAQPVSEASSTRNGKVVSESAADETLRLVEEYGDNFAPYTPEKEKKLRRKIQFHILFLICIIDLMLFVSAWFVDRNRWQI